MSGEDTMDTDSRVKLAEIGGDIKRIFDHIARHTEDYQLVSTRLNGHSNRLTALEKDKDERVGMAKAIKWAYAAIGGGVGTIIIGAAAMFARSLGA